MGGVTATNIPFHDTAAIKWMRKDRLCSVLDFECGTSMIVLAWIEPYFCAYSLHHMHNCWYYYIFKVARFDHCFTGFFITVNS